jgi:hypothetical protein
MPIVPIVESAIFVTEPLHNQVHTGDGFVYAFWEEDGYWEFWSLGNNLLGQYATWEEAVKVFPELEDVESL